MILYVLRDSRGEDPERACVSVQIITSHHEQEQIRIRLPGLGLCKCSWSARTQGTYASHLQAHTNDICWRICHLCLPASSHLARSIESRWNREYQRVTRGKVMCVTSSLTQSALCELVLWELCNCNLLTYWASTWLTIDIRYGGMGSSQTSIIYDKGRQPCSCSPAGTAGFCSN